MNLSRTFPTLVGVLPSPLPNRQRLDTKPAFRRVFFFVPGQHSADAVAFDSVQNHLTARAAKVRRDGLDGDIAHGDIAGVSHEGVSATTKALHWVKSGRGLKHSLEPF